MLRLHYGKKHAKLTGFKEQKNIWHLKNPTGLANNVKEPLDYPRPKSLSIYISPLFIDILRFLEFF